MKIGIRLAQKGTFEPNYGAYIQGDELIAIGWQKYLTRAGYDVVLYGRDEQVDVDVLIHFQPNLSLGRSKNIYYFQNAFVEGNLVAFAKLKSSYDGFMFVSEELRAACGVDGAVVLFATDPEMFFPQFTEEYADRPTFVGASHFRGEGKYERFFNPLLPYGLVLYGSGWERFVNQSGRPREIYKGKLPLEEMPRLYSSCSANLNLTAPEHTHYGVINARVYDILACNGVVISDFNTGIEREFPDILMTDGGAELVRLYINNLNLILPETRPEIIKKHTYAARVPSILAYLKEIL